MGLRRIDEISDGFVVKKERECESLHRSECVEVERERKGVMMLLLLVMIFFTDLKI